MANEDISLPSKNLIGDEYSPGVCNIGPAEIRKRKNMLYVAIIALILVTFIFLMRGVFLGSGIVISTIMLILVFLASTGTMINSFQVKSEFCVAFAFQGVHNFGDLTEKKSKLSETDYIQKDKSRAFEIIKNSSLIGLIFTFLVFIFDYFIFS
jgi:hypothetical protein